MPEMIEMAEAVPVKGRASALLPQVDRPSRSATLRPSVPLLILVRSGPALAAPREPKKSGPRRSRSSPRALLDRDGLDLPRRGGLVASPRPR
jgi:hypothetical protein